MWPEVFSSFPVVVLAVMSVFVGTKKRVYRVAAVILGFLAIAFVWGQAYIHGQSQNGLRDDVASTKRTANRILDVVTVESPVERRLLKSVALDWSDRAETFLGRIESQKISPAFHIASATQGNFSGYLISDLARCESLRAEAKSLRDKILVRIPEARDATATAGYTAKECVGSLPVVLGDLKRTALRLPD